MSRKTTSGAARATLKFVNLVDLNADFGFEDGRDEVSYSLRTGVTAPDRLDEDGDSCIFFCYFHAIRLGDKGSPTVRIRTKYGVLGENFPRDEKSASEQAKMLAATIVWQRFAETVSHCSNQMKVEFPLVPQFGEVGRIKIVEIDPDEDDLESQF